MRRHHLPPWRTTPVPTIGASELRFPPKVHAKTWAVLFLLGLNKNWDCRAMGWAFLLPSDTRKPTALNPSSLWVEGMCVSAAGRVICFANCGLHHAT